MKFLVLNLENFSRVARKTAQIFAANFSYKFAHQIAQNLRASAPSSGAKISSNLAAPHQSAKTAKPAKTAQIAKITKPRRAPAKPPKLPKPRHSKARA